MNWWKKIQMLIKNDKMFTIFQDLLILIILWLLKTLERCILELMEDLQQ